MPSSFQIGPLMLAADRAFAVILIAAFMALSGLLARRMDRRAERVSFWAPAAGIIAARAGFVASNWDAFAVEPASILAIWQGGFSLTAGLAGAIAAIVLTLPLRQPAVALAGAASDEALIITTSALGPRPLRRFTGLTM